MAVEHGPITIEKITPSCYQATTNATKPFKAKVTMTGISAKAAEEKLILFLNNKPYKHLDQNGSK